MVEKKKKKKELCRLMVNVETSLHTNMDGIGPEMRSSQNSILLLDSVRLGNPGHKWSESLVQECMHVSERTTKLEVKQQGKGSQDRYLHALIRLLE